MSPTSIDIPLPTHFDFSAVMDFLTPRAVPGLEAATRGSYARTFRFGGSLHSVEFQHVARDHAFTVRSTPPVTPAVAQLWSQRVFDISVDLAPFWKMVATDPVLSRIESRGVDLRLSQYVDPFEGLIRAILGQQVSVAGARTTIARLVQQFGETAPESKDAALRGFPTAQHVEDAGYDAIRNLGLTQAKTRCICTVAQASLDRTLDWDTMSNAPPPTHRRSVD